MSESKGTITVNVNVEMTTASLQAIVENAKKVEGRNEKGVYRIDTADKVSEMISNFILENDFESYAKNIENYPRGS
jgi:hypothetical protein